MIPTLDVVFALTAVAIALLVRFSRPGRDRAGVDFFALMRAHRPAAPDVPADVETPRVRVRRRSHFPHHGLGSKRRQH